MTFIAFTLTETHTHTSLSAVCVRASQSQSVKAMYTLQTVSALAVCVGRSLTQHPTHTHTQRRDSLCNSASSRHKGIMWGKKSMIIIYDTEFSFVNEINFFSNQPKSNVSFDNKTPVRICWSTHDDITSSDDLIMWRVKRCSVCRKSCDETHKHRF